MNSDRLLAILHSNDLANEIESLTSEERHFLITSDDFLCGLIIDELFKNNIKLFDEEESLKLYKEKPELFLNIGVKHTKLYVLNLPIDFVINEFIAKGEFHDYSHLIREPQKHFHELLRADKECVLYSLFAKCNDEDLDSLMKNPIIRKKYNLFYCLKSDEYIMKNLHLVPIYAKGDIICGLNDDNNKIKLLNIFTPDKGLIISSIKDDAVKEQLFNKYRSFLSEEDKGKIIGSMRNSEIIERHLNQLKTNDAKYCFLRGIKDEENLIPKETFKDMAFSLKEEMNLLSILYNSWLFFDQDFIKKVINRINKKESLLSILRSGCIDDSYLATICERFGQNNIIRYVNENFNRLPNKKLLLYLPDNNLFKILGHINFRGTEYDNDYFPLLQKIAAKYNLNLDHLVRLTSIVSLDIIEQIQNTNIINAINLDEESFNNYLKIFDRKNCTQDRTKVSSILYSLLNKRFSLQNPDSIQIFSRTLHALTDGDMKLVESLIVEVLSKVDITHFNLTKEELIKGLLNKNEDIIAQYNLITHEYLVNVRNKYVNDAMEDCLGMCMTCAYEENSYINYLLKVSRNEEILEFIKSKSYYEYYRQNPTIIEILKNKELLLALIEFKKSPNKEMASVLKPYLKDFNNLLKYAFKEQIDIVSEYKLYGVPRVYEPRELNHDYLMEVVANIDPLKMKDLVFANSVIFQELLKFLETYCALDWSPYSRICTSADVEMLPSTAGSLISNFAYIYQQMLDAKKEGKNFTFTSALSTAEILDSDADIYACLFGKENYSYLKRNPGPNASPMNKQRRLNKALDYLRILHDRKYIPVPPVDKDFSLSSGKSLNIIIGNTNNPINLTYGERTGACMRIGGAGSSLFDFCLKNDNGFHISFNNPNTGALVSRVSCYVNGNTVFFNQVRYSLNEEYSNDDIREATALIGKEIIELTKNSKNPIQNVVTSPCYAFSGALTVKTQCSDPTRGYIPSFYTDINEDAVVIASVGEPMVPIRLNPLKVSKYEVGRSHIYRVENEKAVNAITHIETLDSFLKGVPIDEIEIPKRNVKVAIYGEDWYVAMTMDNQIIDYISKSSRNINKAKEEHDHAMRRLNTETKNSQVQQQYDMINQEEINLGQEVQGKGR